MIVEAGEVRTCEIDGEETVPASEADGVCEDRARDGVSGTQTSTWHRLLGLLRLHAYV